MPKPSFADQRGQEQECAHEVGKTGERQKEAHVGLELEHGKDQGTDADRERRPRQQHRPASDAEGLAPRFGERQAPAADSSRGERKNRCLVDRQASGGRSIGAVSDLGGASADHLQAATGVASLGELTPPKRRLRRRGPAHSDGGN